MSPILRQDRHGTRILALIIVGCTVFVAAPTVRAAEEDVTLFLRPHCTDTQKKTGDCPAFEVEDPETLKTSQLRVGDILDIDIMVANPSAQSIKHVRSWLIYDPNILQGDDIEIAEEFGSRTPGESDFSDTEGYAKLEASTGERSGIDEEEIFFARIQFTVLSVPPTGGTIIAFHDAQPEGHTVVIVEEGRDEEAYALKAEPGSLHVLFAKEEKADEKEVSTATGAAATSNAFDIDVAEGTNESEDGNEGSASTSSTIANDTDAPQNVERTAFSLLQVQNVRVTTQGSSVFVGWDDLLSSQLKGYNVYYGTVSGQYIQRRSVPKQAKSLTIPALPVGTRYFFAVRAVNEQDTESAFSQEVAVTVSEPGSSTAPLVPSDMPPDSNLTAEIMDQGTLPGKTGTPSIVAILIVLSALTGTVFAWRRQCIVTPL